MTLVLISHKIKLFAEDVQLYVKVVDSSDMANNSDSLD